MAQIGGALRFFPLAEPLSLPKPVLSTARLTNNAVALNWIDQSLETGFTLQERLAGSNVWENVATPEQNITQAIVSGLLPRTGYEFRIKADAPGLSSDWSDVLALTTPGLPPGPVTLNPPTATMASVFLSWSNPADEDGVILERRIGAVGAWSVLQRFPANATNDTDSAVLSGTNYNYRIEATNQWGAGPGAAEDLVGFTSPAPRSRVHSAQGFHQPRCQLRGSVLRRPHHLVACASGDVLDEPG